MSPNEWEKRIFIIDQEGKRHKKLSYEIQKGTLMKEEYGMR